MSAYQNGKEHHQPQLEIEDHVQDLLDFDSVILNACLVDCDMLEQCNFLGLREESGF